MKSVALHNLGCKVNGYEMDVMQQMLQEKGYKIVSFDEAADIYIVNTCTVTNIADRKSRQMLHRARKSNPDAIVVAVGCYVQTGKEDILQDAGVDLAIGNNKKNELTDILEKFLANRNDKSTEKEKLSKTLDETTIADISRIKEFEDMQLKETAGHTRAYIKIQDGCNQFCSYCIIPYARGRVRSRSREEILREIKTLSEKGYQEVVLTGIHMSSYGIDQIESLGETKDKYGSRLSDLIKEISAVEGIKRIRLGSLEPGIITEEFAQVLSSIPAVCPHFHLSLQSGCDKTLKRMNRQYTAGEYLEKANILRRFFLNPAITTDVITGFPGETEEEFEETRAFLEKIKFYEMHIFKYSIRKGTRAAEMDHQVKDEVKMERSAVLLAMEECHSKEYRTAYIGKEAEVLFEEEKTINGVCWQIGHTKQYVKVAKQSGQSLCNLIISGKLTGFMGDDLLIME